MGYRNSSTIVPLRDTVSTSVTLNNTGMYLPDLQGFETTWLPEENIPTLDAVDIIKMCVLISLAVISLIGNIMTLGIIYSMRTRSTTVRVLIGNLCVADLLVTFFCMIVDAVWSYTVSWNGGNASCKILKFLQVFSLYASTYVLVLIAVDRCHAIMFPMARIKAPMKLKIMLTIVWIGSGILALPQVTASYCHLFRNCSNSSSKLAFDNSVPTFRLLDIN